MKKMERRGQRAGQGDTPASRGEVPVAVEIDSQRDGGGGGEREKGEECLGRGSTPPAVPAQVSGLSTGGPKRPVKRARQAPRTPEPRASAQR